MSKPKILLLDVETVPNLVYTFDLFNVNISVEQIVEPGRVVCWAAQWYGEKDVMFAAEWGVGRRRMFETMRDLMNEADAVITYNGDKFDIPKLRGEFAKEWLMPPGPVASIDLYRTVKTLGLPSNKLAFVAPFLKIGEKVKHEGIRLWLGVLSGDRDCEKRMEKYNKQDTRLLGKLYKRLIPFIKNHPYLGTDLRPGCSACGSMRQQKRGTRRTKRQIIDRLQCQKCGKWDDGARQTYKPERPSAGGKNEAKR